MADPITAFVGRNGSGKTLALVEKVVMPGLRDGKTIVSNIAIFKSPADAHLPSEERELHPQYVPLRSWRQIDDNMRGCVLVLDEISSMFEARESSKMPIQITTRLQQLRKGDNFVAWTAPDWGRADVVLRRVTFGVWSCRGYFPQKVEGRSWRSMRLMRWKHYSGASFEEFSQASANSDRKGTLRADQKSWYLRERHEAQHMYDTYASVSLLDHLDEYGSCVDCGGTRRRPACSCGKDHEPTKTATRKGSRR